MPQQATKIISDTFINEMILCSKIITDRPSKEMKHEGQYLRNGMKLRSECGNFTFSVYMRQHAVFEENFSIGLIYCPSDLPENITLLRCNGPHGPHREIHRTNFHIHRASENNIKLGIKPEASADITGEYKTFNQAFRYFNKTCNIKGVEKYFSLNEQLSLLGLKDDGSA